MFKASSLLKNYLKPSYVQNQIRGTKVVSRINRTGQFEKGMDQDEINLRTRHTQFCDNQYRYQKYKDQMVKLPKRKIDILLLNSIPEFGPKGAIINVDEDLARRKLILPNIGTYPTPENLERHKDILLPPGTVVESSQTSYWTRNFLSVRVIPVFMNMHNAWTLEPSHMVVSFLQMNVVIKPENIHIPREITGPNMDNDEKEFYVTVTINNLEKVDVRCVLKHYCGLVTQPKMPKYFWYKFFEPVFERDRKHMRNLPRVKWGSRPALTNELIPHHQQFKAWKPKRNTAYIKQIKGETLAKRLIPESKMKEYNDDQLPDAERNYSTPIRREP